MTIRGVSLALALISALSSAAGAQRGADSAAGRSVRPRAAARAQARGEARAGRAGRGAGVGAPGARRQALAGQVRQAFAGVVRRQLGLNDDQAKRLQEVDRRFQQQRVELQRQERAARLGIGLAIQKSRAAGGNQSGADQTDVARYMDQLVQAQHRRAELLDAEQKELSAFLTPVQRAKYQALREQLNLKVRELQQRGAGGAGGAGGAAADSTER